MASPPPSFRARPHSWVAALLSAFFPGLGQVYAGATVRGAAMVGVDIVLLAVAYVALQNRLELVKAWVRPGGLALFMLFNVALLGYRAWAAYDAATIERRPPGRTTAGGLVVAGIVAAVVLVPHAVFGYYDLVQFNFITTTFEADDVSALTSTTTDPSGDGGNEVPATAADTTAPAEPALWDGLDRLNVLLLGGDAGPDRRAIRTDTMIVASIDPQTGYAAMLSVPRNWARAPLPAGHGVWECQCFPRILNDLFYAGEVEHPDAFPGPGTPGENAIKGGISELLGVPIHFYAMVSLEGFVGIIDALGGVEIEVPFRIVDEEYPHENGLEREYVDIQPGTQVLDGHFALAYARIRRHADDYARMSRQRCVLEALLEQSDPVELALAYPRILGVLKDTLQTDIPISRLDDFIDLLPLIEPESIVALRVLPDDYRSGYNDFGYSVPDVELIQEHVDVVMTSTPEDAIAALGIQTLEDACG